MSRSRSKVKVTRSKNVSMGISMECLPGNRLGNITESNTTTWGVFKAYAVSFIHIFVLAGKVDLNTVTDDDIATYTCHSVPIATKARYNHNQELRLLRQPWWKKLGDEYQDEKLDEELDWKQF